MTSPTKSDVGLPGRGDGGGDGSGESVGNCLGDCLGDDVGESSGGGGGNGLDVDIEISGSFSLEGNGSPNVEVCSCGVNGPSVVSVLVPDIPVDSRKMGTSAESAPSISTVWYVVCLLPAGRCP